MSNIHRNCTLFLKSEKGRSLIWLGKFSLKEIDELTFPLKNKEEFVEKAKAIIKSDPDTSDEEKLKLLDLIETQIKKNPEFYFELEYKNRIKIEVIYDVKSDLKKITEEYYHENWRDRNFLSRVVITNYNQKYLMNKENKAWRTLNQALGKPNFNPDDSEVLESIVNIKAALFMKKDDKYKIIRNMYLEANRYFADKKKVEDKISKEQKEISERVKENRERERQISSIRMVRTKTKRQKPLPNQITFSDRKLHYK